MPKLSDSYAATLAMAEEAINTHPVTLSKDKAIAALDNSSLKSGGVAGPVKVKRRLPEPTKTFLAGKQPSPKYLEKVLAYVEDYWFRHKEYPPAQEMAEYHNVPLAEILHLNSNKNYELALRRRGIELPKNSEILTPAMNAAILCVTNLNDTRPLEVKLASVGVTLAQYNGWQAHKLFQRTLRERSEDVFNNAGVDANLGLATLIKEKDFKAIKFYMDITGKSNSPEAINLRQTVQILIEAVQKHVKDPETLQLIAAEVQAVQSIVKVD